MNSLQLVESFSEFKDMKNIDRPTLMKVLEDIFRTIIRKKYETDENFDIIVNTEKGDLEIWHRRMIVEDGMVQNPATEISLTDALVMEPDFQVGEETYEEVNIESFGRRIILAIRQALTQKINELEKDEIFKKYNDRIGDIVTGEVYQVWKKEVLLLDDDGNELILPRMEMIPSDNYKKRRYHSCGCKNVELRNGNPLVILSRTESSFLAKLMEQEVPEVFDGLIVIRRIVRAPGERAKVAVESFDDRIDPVGACVGMKGSRIHGIVRELRNENIDIINYTNNMSLLIQRALSPAKINSIELDAESKRARVFLSPDQVSLAIGKGGLNIKLACSLTGYDIDVFRDTEEEDYDVDLDEFTDEIEEWMIDELKSIGCDTAKSVLELSVDDLVRRTDLEEETIREIMRILKDEFDGE
ncbi:MAG: transcription termination/antitermination protein NusA [Bacteroidetes bacterium]|nr:transcription termination/antitermination protein NusA [Bacteroidota bacterium]